MGEEKYAIPSGNCKKTFFSSVLTSMWVVSILKKKKQTTIHIYHHRTESQNVGWNQLGFHICSQKMIEGCFGVVCSVCNSSIFFLIGPAKTH